jgi:glyoxylase-like metal-dependent hydrolase (beta-lactamase superfamily II)
MDMNKDLYLVREIGNNIYLIDDNKYATAYLLIGENKALLIDTGTGFGDLKSLVTDLTNLPIVVVNTHGHSDHVWGNYQFEEAYISKEDMQLYEDSYSQEERENIIKVFRDTMPSEITQEELNEWIKLKPCKTLILKQGDVIDLGGKVLQVVEVPGHTRGSIVLMDEKDEILFSGDSLIGRLWMHLEESSDLKTYLSSIKGLKSYSSKLKRIYCGHTKYEEDPYDISFIDDVISDVTDIVEGRKTGTYLKDNSGECLVCEFENWSIWYNPNEI